MTPPSTVSARLRSVRGPSDPPLTLVPPAAEPNPRTVILLLIAAVLLPRLLLMPFNENFLGDAVIRSELAERWARHPHWISSFQDGAFQFGPLQLYLVGLVLDLGVPRADAGRWVSLLFGVLSVWPLYALCRRMFGWRAGVWAGLALAAWGMHLQFSTTAGSEALALCLVLGVVALVGRALEETGLSSLFWAAVLLNLACATRYDAWLLIPLLSVLLFVASRDRIAGITRAVLFGLLCLPFPLAWMQGNERALGDPLYPIHFIEQFHRDWVRDGVAFWGGAQYRLINLGWWPGTAVVTLTPLLALFAFAGMVQVWRTRPEARWLLWVSWAPTAYYALRGAVLLDFTPVARFTVIQLALWLPFIGPGFEALLGSRPRWLRRTVAAVALASLVGFTVWLGVFTFRREGKYETSLRPISPTSTNPPELMRVARFLHDTVLPTDAGIILDDDPTAYLDLQLAFFSGLPEARMARWRWEDFPKVLAKLNPEYLVRIDGGTLGTRLSLSADGQTAVFEGRTYRALPGFSGGYHVYRWAH